MATIERRLVHKQFNSPIGMYSDQNIKETLNRDLKSMSNGAVGIEMDNNIKNTLANSAVLRLLEEEEAEKRGGGKKVAWPPRSDASPSRNLQQQQHPSYPSQGGANYQSPQQPQQQYQPPQQQYQPPQQQYQPPQQQYQPPQQQYQPPQQQYQPPQPQYQPPQVQYQPPTPQQTPQSPNRWGSQPPLPTYSAPAAEPSYVTRKQPEYLESKPGFLKGPSPTVSFAGGIPVVQRQSSPYTGSPAYSSGQTISPQSDYQRPPVSQSVERTDSHTFPGWSHVKPATPTYTGYTQQSPGGTRYMDGAPDFGQAQTQYQQPQSQAYQPPQPAYQQQPQYQAPQQQQQYSQPQYQAPQQQYQQPEQYQQPQQDFYRQPSPGYVTLRNEAPVSQKSAPVYASQPATAMYRESSAGGSNMRGDQKWPPTEYKEAAAVENEARRRLAAGPACRPRKVHKDYTQFFGQHALNNNYPGYKVPPGTQHIESFTPYRPM